jgi:uncharacterized membrane protein YuzA (DUF378 family)
MGNECRVPEESGNEATNEKEEIMRKMDVLAAVLVVIGALNWGLVGIARFDIVATLFGMGFGETSWISSLVFTLVGAAGFYQFLSWKAIQRRWQPAVAPSRAR